MVTQLSRLNFELPHQNLVLEDFVTVDPSTPEDGLWFLAIRDADEIFTYRLVKGKGDDDNKLFAVQGDKLITKTVFDYEDEEVLQCATEGN